jgi:hypothetical protein
MPEADRPASYKDLTIEAVTQSYQETIHAFALWCSGKVGVPFDQERFDALLGFVAWTQREPGERGPRYRTLTDGTPRDDKDSTFYHGTLLAMALERSDDIMDWVGAALTDFTTNDADDPFAWLASQPESKRANTWHLMGLLKPGGGE